MVDDNVVEEGKEHDEIVLQGFNLFIFGKYEEGVGREVLSEYNYLLMLINIWPGDWNNRPERINIKLDKENGKYL